MSQLKYFFIFSISPSRRILNYFSLKNSCIFTTFSTCFIFGFFFIMNFINIKENIILIIFKHLSFSILNFISFVFMVKSLYQFDYKKAYIGNLSIVWAFIFHIILFIINFLFQLNFSSINLKFLNYKKLSNFIEFTLPNFIYLIFELLVTWICYSYTKNLSDGNDALVDGQNFDRYIENLGSDSQSKDINSGENINDNKTPNYKENDSVSNFQSSMF